MKKLISLLLALVLACSLAATATAESLLTLERIQSIVDDAGWEVYKVNEEDKYVWVNLYDEDMDYVLLMGVYIEGNSDNILNVYLLQDDYYAFSKKELDTALSTCNDWNVNKRWPTAYVDTENYMFRGDNSLPCTSDVSDDMLMEYMERHMSAFKQYITFLGEAGFDQFSGIGE